jgi:hypothetical protein
MALLSSLDWQFAATSFATAITIIDPIGMAPMTLSSRRASLRRSAAR